MQTKKDPEKEGKTPHAGGKSDRVPTWAWIAGGGIIAAGAALAIFRHPTPAGTATSTSTANPTSEPTATPTTSTASPSAETSTVQTPASESATIADALKALSQSATSQAAAVQKLSSQEQAAQTTTNQLLSALAQSVTRQRTTPAITATSPPVEPIVSTPAPTTAVAQTIAKVSQAAKETIAQRTQALKASVSRVGSTVLTTQDRAALTSHPATHATTRTLITAAHQDHTRIASTPAAHGLAIQAPKVLRAKNPKSESPPSHRTTRTNAGFLRITKA